MVLILDGNSEHVVLVCRKICAKKEIRFVAALDLNKCRSQAKTPRSLHMCATIIALPYNDMYLGPCGMWIKCKDRSSSCP